MTRETSGRSTDVGPGLALGALVVVAAALLGTWLVLGRGGGPAPPATRVEPAAIDHEPGTGVTPQGDPRLGAASAPVTIVEYSDYQCPNCRQFATEVVPWLRETWLARGFVSVVYRDFAIRGEGSVRAAEAAHCAGEQGRYWSYHDALFESQAGEGGAWTEENALVALAAELELDVSAFRSCLSSRRHRARVEASTREATERGFEGTPTFDINGRVTAGAIPIESWNELFNAYRVELGG